MLTLLGALLGFLGSAFPELLKLFYHKQDCTHELAIMDRQIELTKLGHSHHLEEIKTQATALEQMALYHHAKPTGVPWVDSLAGSVRPLITYAFFLVYALIKLAQWKFALIMAGDPHWSEALLSIWRDEDKGLFAAIISFWFGCRALNKKNGNGL